FDTVTAEPGPPGRVEVSLSGPGADLVGPDQDNLAVRAADLLRRQAGRPELGVRLRIDKAIPVAGGMAGGSADAAASLLACAQLWGLPVERDDLLELARQLGADVPFALVGGCAVGQDRGDRLLPALQRGLNHWVLALSERGLSTARVFQRHDELAATAPPPPLTVPADLMTALASGDPVRLGAALSNDLAAAACALAPHLRQLTEAGHSLGALGAVVSGSGPTVALLARDGAHAIDLAVKLSSLGLAQRVLRVSGPVPGAQIIPD
ncbi:MAG: 4-(cytidine 5'-diphospho)-2-C-methyl-D-erythritol kinase, partial [Propionibacteriaceae bacterium]|nr:4-(cytidine 5'-diphospho)-2-C-methyl-D-erythritol kinase [Propionibacteriaceae bacterium]